MIFAMNKCDLIIVIWAALLKQYNVFLKNHDSEHVYVECTENLHFKSETIKTPDTD